MPRNPTSLPLTPPAAPLRHWRRAQDLALAAGLALFLCLLVAPGLGLDLLWNGLIPLAPALLVVLPGVWRNLCPLASLAMLPQRLGLGRRRRPGKSLGAGLALGGLLALLIIVPYRHIGLDRDATASALMLLIAGLAALLGGSFGEGRSAWCNSLCPIHPAERLYGGAPAWTPVNARCAACSQCSRPCPDSTRALNPTLGAPDSIEQQAGHLLVGGFAGFVWGWHQVGDLTGPATPAALFAAYAWPLGSGAVSLLVYQLARRRLAASAEARRQLVRRFAWAAVTLYYWYRLPALIGLGEHFGTGLLIDCRALGRWPAWLARALSTGFLTWFMLLRRPVPRAWLARPQPATTGAKKRATDCAVALTQR